MKKILILTASFGDGHNAAARSLREAIEFLDRETKVEVLDVFESTYGTLNTLLKQAYQGVVRYAPALWSGMFNIFDSPALFGRQINSMGGLRDALRVVFEKGAPDVVVSTYPVYSHLIEQLFPEVDERPFRFITVVTDSISICSAWYRARSDLFVVANDPTAEVLVKAGVPASRIRALGFPVSPLFAQERTSIVEPPFPGRPKVLYVINTGKSRAGKSLQRLLKLERIDLTITVGRDSSLKAKLSDRLQEYGDRVRIIGWTNQMPRLLMSHHLVIGKAGGAMVQEAIAARCPMIVNQVIPGQEEGNARLIQRLGVGAVAERKKDVPELVQEAFAHHARQWEEWRANLRKASRPDSALRIAELVLGESDPSTGQREPINLFPSVENSPLMRPEPHCPRLPSAARMLLCDFHIHTNYSDGRLTLPEVIDFYGRRKFDCICVTDHVGYPRRFKGRFRKLHNLTLACAQFDEYFDLIERERRRAWRRYGMLVMAGLEFNTPGLTRKTSGHLLALDLQAPISPSLEVGELIAQIHSQGALAVAAHPHTRKTAWGKNTLFFWQHYEMFAPVLDAWEIATRQSIFTPAGLKHSAFLASSDFHKPKHIYSWKTLVHCEPHRDAIKDCIRWNKQVAMAPYEDGLSADSFKREVLRKLRCDEPLVPDLNNPRTIGRSALLAG